MRTGSPTSTSPRGSRCATAPPCPRTSSSGPPRTASGALALTDRDGLYGAVRFATACGRAGIAPVLGVDLAVEPLGSAGGRRLTAGCRAPAPRPRTPVRGGAIVDPRHAPGHRARPGPGRPASPRVPGGRRCAGWSPQTHLRGERGVPVTTPDLLARWPPRSPAQRCRPAAARPASRRRAGCSSSSAPTPTSAGPSSPAAASGPATCSRRGAPLLPARRRWPSRSSSTAGPRAPPAAASHAARLLGLADEAGVPAVLTAAVRHADPEQVRTVDVLDAARRLVVLDSRHLDRVTDAGHLASTAAMHASALEVTGGDRARADRLVAMTSPRRRRVHPATPAPTSASARSTCPRPRCSASTPATDPHAGARRSAAATRSARRYPGVGEAERQVVLDPARRRARASSPTLGYPTYFLTVAEVTDLIRARGVRVAARGSGAGSLVNHLLGISGVDPIRHRPAHGAVLLPAARRAARHRRRRRVGPAHRDLRGGPRPLRRRAGHLRVDDGHLQGAPRRPRRRRRARAAAGRGRRDRQGVPAHPGQGRPQRHRRPARAAQPRPRQPAAGDLLRPRRGASTACPATSRCTRAGSCCPTPGCSTAPRSRRAGWASR